MKYLLVSVLGSVMILSACVTESSDVIDPLELAISGKTLVSDSAVLTLNSDRTLTGAVGADLESELIGTWYVSNGRFCRTITAPARLAGQACQNMRLRDNGAIVEVDGVNRTIAYDVR